jgi:hypothetical protein
MLHDDAWEILRARPVAAGMGTAEGSYYVGGLAGENSGGVAKCYSASAILGRQYIVGGLVGYNDPDHGKVTDCFWDTKTWGANPG